MTESKKENLSCINCNKECIPVNICTICHKDLVNEYYLDFIYVLKVLNDKLKESFDSKSCESKVDEKLKESFENVIVDNSKKQILIDKLNEEIRSLKYEIECIQHFNNYEVFKLNEQNENLKSKLKS